MLEVRRSLYVNGYPGHRKDTQKPRNGNNRLYKRMNEIGLQNWKIIPLLTFSCTKKIIREFEKQYISLTGADLNMMSPITYRKEYNTGYYLKNKKQFNSGMQVTVKSISKIFGNNKQVTVNLTYKIRYIIVMYVISRLGTGRI